MFNYDTALSVSQAVVMRHWRLVNQVKKKMTPEELAYELAQDVWYDYSRGKYRPEKFKGYDDPKRTRFGSWAKRVAYFGLLDRVRSAEYLIRKETMIVERAKEHALQFQSVVGDIEVPPRINRGRIGHPPTAYASMLVYKETHRLGWDRLYAQMRADPALVRMFGFASCPALSRLRDSKRRLLKWSASCGDDHPSCHSL